MEEQVKWDFRVRDIYRCGEWWTIETSHGSFQVAYKPGETRDSLLMALGDCHQLKDVAALVKEPGPVSKTKNE